MNTTDLNRYQGIYLFIYLCPSVWYQLNKTTRVAIDLLNNMDPNTLSNSWYFKDVNDRRKESLVGRRRVEHWEYSVLPRQNPKDYVLLRDR
jgi:hypothetical protein